MKESGQIIIVLLLMMLVGLSIGLVVTQRSVTDVATSTQSEQSQRAFSAAEAGIEKALSQNSASDLSLGNESSAQVTSPGLVPAAAVGGGNGQALEYPPIDKTKTAHFWLADSSSTPPSASYIQPTFEVYFGEPGTTDKPAIEVNVIALTATGYKSFRYFYDSDGTRTGSNKFDAANCSPTKTLTNTANIYNRSQTDFYCKVTVPPATSTTPYSGTPMIARVRLLYSNGKHRIALQPIGGSLPPQAEIYTSVGKAGQSQKTLRVFRMKNVVPFLFDFALFSAGEITK